MAFVKHPEHGNKHVADHEVAELVKQGWVKWPRSKDEKALGDGSDAAYWRKKYERDVAGKSDDHTALISALVSGSFPALDGGEVEILPVRNKPGPKPKA